MATRQVSGATCYAGDRYVVVAKHLEVGSDLFVRPRAAPDAEPTCQVDSVPGDMVFRSDDVTHHPDALHFLGLKGDLLLAWDGTGGASDLYVYDLRKREKALQIDAIDVDDLRWPDSTSLMLWITKAYGQSAAAAGCADTMPGNPPQLDSLVRLQLPGLEQRPTGRFRCTVGQ